MSRAALTGDCFVGQVHYLAQASHNLTRTGHNLTRNLSLRQCILDIPSLSFAITPGEELALDLPICGSPDIPLFNIIGEKCPTQPPPRVDSGVVKVKLSLPSPFTDMCGWFSEITTNIFGVQSRALIWVVLHRNNANKWFCIAYDSKFSGDSGLKRTIDCHMIKSVRSRVDTNTIEMVIGSANEQVIWAWEDDSAKHKGKWLRSLSRNVDFWSDVDSNSAKAVNTPRARGLNTPAAGLSMLSSSPM
jgi:hypothetical protein